MSQLEEQLNKIRLQKMTEAEKNSVWFSVVSKQTSSSSQRKLLESFFFKKYMIATLLALVVVLGGGGVVAASNASVPGDALYGIDQAVERIQLKVTSEGKKSELKVKFATERLSEAEEVVREGSRNVRPIDLSSASVTEIEVDVFTNETTVKIEAGDKHYGFITDKTDREEIIEEIQEKYNLSLEQIESVLSFETEDRDSRADDKDFLNSANSLSFKSPKQKQELEGSITEVADLIAESNLSDEQKANLSVTLASLLTLLETNPDLEIEFKTSDGFKLEVEDGQIEIKTNNGKGAEKGKSDERGSDIRENENEVFCRGEWRDPADCTDDDSDSDDDESDDSDEDSDEDDSDDDNNSNSRSGKGNKNDNDDSDEDEDEDSEDDNDDSDEDSDEDDSDEDSDDEDDSDENND